MNRPVAVAADAFPDVGLGHLSRSGAIAVALRTRGADVRTYGLGAPTGGIQRDGLRWTPLADAGALDAPVVVVDSYRTPGPVLARLAKRMRVVILQDDGLAPPGAALVVSPHLASRDSNGWLTGLTYACLRPAFWGLPRRRIAGTVERVLVTTGGGDPDDMAGPLAASVAAALPTARVRLVRGPQAPPGGPDGVDVVRHPESLLGSLLEADLVVTGGGQTLLEAAACGTPSVALPLAAEQVAQSDVLARAGATVVATASDAPRRAAALADDPDRRRALASAGQRAVDGYGALRVAFAVARL